MWNRSDESSPRASSQREAYDPQYNPAFARRPSAPHHHPTEAPSQATTSRGRASERSTSTAGETSELGSLLSKDHVTSHRQVASVSGNILGIASSSSSSVTTTTEARAVSAPPRAPLPNTVHVTVTSPPPATSTSAPQQAERSSKMMPMSSGDWPIGPPTREGGASSGSSKHKKVSPAGLAAADLALATPCRGRAFCASWPFSFSGCQPFLAKKLNPQGIPKAFLGSAKLPALTAD